MGNSGQLDRGVRLENVLREEVEAILRCEARDPALTSIVITRVELSGGGARARVWWQSHEEKTYVSEALERARGFIRSRVAEALGTKRTPELVFRWDPTARMEDGR
jgi:ribosome-binding factor A